MLGGLSVSPSAQSAMEVGVDGRGRETKKRARRRIHERD